MKTMTLVRFSAAAAALLIASICVSAQQDPEDSQTGDFPATRMAILYSEAFLEPKNGIARFSNLLNTLNREFQPRQTELQNLQTRMNALEKEIEETQNVADPNTIRVKRDQYQQLNTDFKRKGEDAEAAYNKRRQEIFAQLERDIGKALEAFAKENGINVIIDGSQVPMVFTADSIDITRAFINVFNGKNP